MKELKRAIKRLASEAAERGTTVNVARRTNVVVASNVGKSGSVHAVSVKQNAPIKQG